MGLASGLSGNTRYAVKLHKFDTADCSRRVGRVDDSADVRARVRAVTQDEDGRTLWQGRRFGSVEPCDGQKCGTDFANPV